MDFNIDTINKEIVDSIKNTKISKNNILNNYQLIKFLGKGSYGNVYLYYHKVDNQKVVVKEFKKFTKTMNDSILKEYWIIHTINKFIKLNIPTYIDFFEYNKKYYLLMNYFEGGCMESFWENHKFRKNQIISYILNIGSIIYILQKLNIVHGDLKLDNIIYNNKLNNFYLIDFNLSCLNLKNYKKINCIGNFFGCNLYKSPKMYLDKAKTIADYYNSDLWSFGVILYMLYYNKAFYTFDYSDDFDDFFTNYTKLIEITEKPHKTNKEKIFNYSIETILKNIFFNEKYTINTLLTEFKENMKNYK